MYSQRGRAPQGVLPAAARLLFLLKVLRAALQQPGQLLEERCALNSQHLASADPALERGLGRDATAWVLTVALEVGLDVLYTVSQPPGGGRMKKDNRSYSSNKKTHSNLI